MEKTRKAYIFLGMGTILFALGPAVLKLLTTMGGQFGIVKPGAISFCNVLFVGNFCAGIITLWVYGVRPIFGELIRLSARTKLALVMGAVFSTLYPALIFSALERTSVINLVLLSRFNAIVFLIFAYLFFRASVRKADFVGYGVIATGVTILVILNNGGVSLRSGEVLVLIATVFFALTELVSKTVLRECSIEAYIFFRNLVSSIIFFVSAIYLFGFHHFADAFAGELWILMVLYAGFAVVAAQLSWMRATRVLSVKSAANAQLVNPILSIAFAYFLLSEVPTALEWAVMLIVLVGTLIPLLSGAERVHREMEPATLGTGFAGIH